MFIKSMIIRGLGAGMVAVALLAGLPAQAAALNIQHWQATSGAEVYFVENHDLPILDVAVNFDAGSARDVKETSGLAGLTRYLMTLGAGDLSDEDIAKKLADIGALIGGELDADRSEFTLRTLSQAREREQALDIFTKILQQPTFPEEILNREKARVIAGLREAATQPESIANKAFMKDLYGKHPYALDDNGDPETVAAIQRDDLQAFYNSHYNAKSAVVAIIGDMTRDEAAKTADRLTAHLPATVEQAALAQVEYPAKAVEERIPHPAMQAHILLGYPGVKRGDPDYFPLYVGNYILGGGGFVSRLTEEVREKRGLVYSVYSYFIPLRELGPFQVGLQTKREQADDALQLVRQTIDQFIRGGVTEAELKAAKQNITGGFPLRIDSNSKILEYLSVIGFYKLPLTYLEDFNGNINKVTTEQIRDAFSRRIKTDKMVTVVVGGKGK